MSSIGSRYDMDEVHDHIQRQAHERELAPRVDMAELSRIASQAYREARGAGSGTEDVEQRALAALEKSGPDSILMIRRAASDLREDSSQVRKREFAYEFMFAAGIPAAGLCAAWLLWAHSTAAAQAIVAVVAVALLCAALFAAFGAVNGRRVARFGSPTSILVHSGGSMAAGLCTLVCVGYLTHRSGEHALREAEDARLTKVNQAAVVTLAARLAGADTSQTQAAVSESTAVDWIRVKAPPSATGSVLLSAELPRRSTAELRATRSASGVEGLASFVTGTSGSTVHYANYFTGTVLQADLKQVTLAVAPSKTEVVQLPSGTLPPSLHSEVVVATAANGGPTLLVQPIDSAVAAFKGLAALNSAPTKKPPEGGLNR